MLKGGYQILNFDGIDILENIDINIPNIYAKLMQTNKPILVSGFSNNRDTFVSVEKVEDTFVIKDFYGYDITITNNDIVRCTKTKSNNVTSVVNVIYTDTDLSSGGEYVEGSYSKIEDSAFSGKPFVWRQGTDTYWVTAIREDGGYNFDVYKSFSVHQQYKITDNDYIERIG